MTKKQYKNLSHSFRFMKRETTEIEALNWIGFHNLKDKKILEQMIKGEQ